tara:strand:+ start:36 stop:458 length:423 start_codon:yes stop_codon:yes gene_type:complete
MSNKKLSKFSEVIIILLIIISIIIVVSIFYVEEQKSNKIKSSENNFYLVKNEISLAILECQKKSLDWKFGGLCSDIPKVKNIENYFKNKKIVINPYNNKKGLNSGDGGVSINILGKKIILTSDFDVDGSDNVEHLFILEE